MTARRSDLGKTKRREAVIAGHRGDERAARAYLRDDDPKVRASALGALARMGRLDAKGFELAFADPEPLVRRRGCELSAEQPAAGTAGRLSDADASVVEAAAWALGERRDATAVGELCAVATAHPDALSREAAVAALGSIGDERGVAAILRALADKPAVRRRAVIALSPFEGKEVDAALERALSDRDWQVRQAAEDLTGRRGPA